MTEEKSLDRFNTALHFRVIHWKSQALAHFIMGLPMAILTCQSWGLEVGSLIMIAVAYMALYMGVYFPLYGLLPRILLRPVRRQLDKWESGQQLELNEVVTLVEFLVVIPYKVVPYVFVIELSAFSAGAVVWATGLVPQLVPVLNVAIFETFVLGLVVSICVSLLNFAFLEQSVSTMVENLLHRYPQVRSHDLKVIKVSLTKKVLILILSTTFSAQLGILLFFTSYLAIKDPEHLAIHIFYIFFVMLSGTIYLVILAPLISHNLARPLNKLVEWSKKVSQGDLTNRIEYVTNDESGELIAGSNMMIEHLAGAENIITTEKNKLSTIITQIEEGIISLDATCSIMVINQAAQVMIGKHQDELIGKQIDSVVKLLDDKDTPLNISGMLMQLVSKESEIKDSIANKSFKIEREGEKPLYVSLNIQYFVSSDQQVHFILTLTDVTKETSLEEMKLDFVSMAAHELRTPLTSIRGYIDLFLEENNKGIPEDQTMYLTRASMSATHLEELIDNLLNVSKIERGNFTLNIAKTDWYALVKELIDQTMFNGKDKNITIEFLKPHDEIPQLEVDPMRIREVMSNLISNAIKYTLPGGKVTIWIDQNDQEVITHVKDTGVGIPEEVKKNLFTKFYRVKRSLEQGVNGTGLGLFMSRAIVQMHKGKIWFDSEVNKGSTFSFSLPKPAKSYDPEIILP